MSFGLAFALPAYPMSSLLGSILNVFQTSSAPGWLYDDSRMDTLYQDAAGTTPVTALEQPVGKQLDLSGRGNHRTQPTSANRPTWSARYNLLTKTEDFSNAAWTNSLLTVTLNATTAPDGTNTGIKLVPTAASGEHRIGQIPTGTAASNTTNVYFKASGYLYGFVRYYSVSTTTYQIIAINLTTGAIALNTGGEATAVVSDAGGGWWKVVVTGIPVSAGSIYSQYGSANTLNGTNTHNFTGNGTDGAYIWHPDLRPSDQATGLIPTYQRVNTATDYDSVGFPAGLRWNGSNSWMQNASTDFSGTNKLSVFVGAISNLPAVVLNMLLAHNGTGYNAFLLQAPDGNGAGRIAFQFAGASAVVDPTATGQSSTASLVIGGLCDIGAPSSTIRINGVTKQTLTTSLGGGNFANASAFFGSQDGSVRFFNGLTFSNIAIGIALSASQIAAFEAWTNSKARAY